MSCEKLKIFVYGAGKRGLELYEKVQFSYADKIEIEGFIDKEKTGIKCGLPIYNLLDVPKDNIIVISIGANEVALQVALDLKGYGFDKVYWYKVNANRKEPLDFFIEQCVDCQDWTEDTLLHVEMHAMNKCNLNCIGCTHFSPILEEKLSDEKQLESIDLLQKKFTSLAQFFVMGGEPFLNKDIVRYVECVKKAFPKAYVYIVTNGLLVPKLSEELLRYIAKENICISISEYEPTHRMINQILEVLNKYNIIYEIREARTNFNKPLSLKPVKERYCISNGCITIAEGKIARCPTLMYIESLNERFQVNFPNKGIIDLKTDVSVDELKNALEEQIPLCDYCIKNEIEWGTCGSSVLLEHFVKTEG